MKVYLKAAENNTTLAKLAPGETFATENVLGVNSHDILIVSDYRENKEGGTLINCVRLQDGFLFHIPSDTAIQVILTEVHVI